MLHRRWLPQRPHQTLQQTDRLSLLRRPILFQTSRQLQDLSWSVWGRSGQKCINHAQVSAIKSIYPRDLTFSYIHCHNAPALPLYVHSSESSLSLLIANPKFGAQTVFGMPGTADLVPEIGIMIFYRIAHAPLTDVSIIQMEALVKEAELLMRRIVFTKKPSYKLYFETCGNSLPSKFWSTPGKRLPMQDTKIDFCFRLSLHDKHTLCICDMNGAMNDFAPCNASHHS